SRLVTADTVEISVESRLPWFHQHKENRPLWIMEKNGEVAGWLSLQDFSGRPAYQTTVEVSVYIKSQYKRLGIADQLLSHLFSQCAELRISTLLALIFSHNEPSIRCFEKHNFQQWGYLPGIAQLDDKKRDVAIYGKVLIS